MNRTKHFVFIVAMTVIMLFIFGNWVASAQATTLGIIDVTPTPTGTPVGITDTLAGEIPSAEEQEELKSLVQSYVEIRYRALSVSDAEDFKQNGFGNLTAETAEVKASLSEEMGKMAVEIKHAELNHLRYVIYKVFLDFHSITVDPETQTATILVTEGNEVMYEISAELDPETPIISRSSGIEHIIVLQKEQGQWKIVSDSYNDDLWKMLRQKGKSTDEILRVTDEILGTMKAVPRPVDGANRIESAFAVPDDPSSHAYDRAGAVKYALDHWSETLGLYNLDYFKFPATDCQNFVSQALYEGGIASMFFSPFDTNLDVGDAGWYYLNDKQYAAGWTEVDFFYRRITLTADHETWDYGEGPEGIDITLPTNDQVPAGLMLGDVIDYDWGKDGTWDHSAIVTDFVGGIPYVAAHTTDHDKVPYTLQTNTNYRFIHIERSNGNPPVKVKTISAADDAGGNPGGSCPVTNSDPGANYFGGCFNGGSITSGFRFTNIRVPRSATIKYAYITLTTDGPYTPATAPISLQIYGENSASPLDFSASPPASRPTFGTPVAWVINGTVNGNAYDTWAWKDKRTTPELKSIIQSIVGLPAWNYGNPLSLIFKNGLPGTTIHRRVNSFEGVPPGHSPARLIAAYDYFGTITTAPTINSLATRDGWILESSENSNVGGSRNSGDATFTLGDSASNQQYRSILHFDTDNLPNTAVITSAVLKIKQGSIVGINPFTTHGSLLADIRKPYFGTGAALANADFEAAVTPPDGQSWVATFDPIPANSWYSASISGAGFPYINLTGTTQFRLYFTTDDNNDLGIDTITFSSGNDVMANRPQLIISYFVP